MTKENNNLQITRNQLLINNNWEFNIGKGESFTRINLPHTWNSNDNSKDGKEYYRGVAKYKKDIELNQDQLNNKKIFLYFEGVNQVATLFVNGNSIGKHIGGYSTFAFDISKSVKAGANTIDLEVTNESDDNIAPLSMDFTFYGGIYRDAFLIVTNSIHFDVLNNGSNGVLISTPNVTEKMGGLNIRTRLLNETNKNRKLILVHRIISSNGKLVETITKNVVLSANSGVNEISLAGKVNTPELWSPDSPKMYTVVSEIKDLETGSVVDQVVNPLGFRWFSMDPQRGFFLNGKHLKLTGVSKHQDFEGLGSAVSNELLIKDLEMMKAMGANCYRSSHYPQDPEVLNACDRLGILVLDEIPLVNSITESEAFSGNCHQVLTEMITRDYNHPSIYSWGLSNEICILAKGRIGSERGNDYDNYLKKIISSLNAKAKSLDPFRFTTQSMHYKTDRYESSGVNKIGDYIGANLYLGWYFGVPDSLIVSAKKMQILSGNKPLMISEYGAGADPRLRADNPRRFDFSLEYQTQVHKAWLKSILNNDFVAGSFVWNFADFSSPYRGDTNPFINNKGIVSYGRIPKDAFYFYEAVLAKKPVINIGMKNWKYHSGIGNSPGSASKKIVIYANTDEAELSINGNSLGQKKVNDYSAEWDVPFRNGKNLIEVSGIASNGEIVKDYHTIDFNLIPSDLHQMKTGDVIRVNAGSSLYFLDEEEKAVWMPDREFTKGSYGFIGGKFLVNQNDRIEYREGVADNIKETVKDPLFQTQRIGVKGFKADVSSGQYEITFCLADLSIKSKSSVYELGKEDDVNKANVSGTTEFDIMINGQNIAENLNPKKIKGELTAYEFSTIIYTESGLNIDFIAKNGMVGINGIKIRKIK
ncbi:glycoside hydrolase family 2 TIM barrel-domain containing protein [Flavobacterium sufflavum]|uniref:glycoside hydrolase family 2 TIM barrel-domain containing protein n=1 Tax=Flavobacterium sufflavum TaxID=1921138 RepID=UPI0013E8A1A9|nr:glycoside hydrolase family 2 TIM barrel-domain containing protein [Flavobacterium sufflavum]